MFRRNDPPVRPPDGKSVTGQNNGSHPSPPADRQAYNATLNHALINFDKRFRGLALPRYPTSLIPQNNRTPLLPHPPAPAAQSSTMAKGRKRQREDLVPTGPKRQRLDSSGFQYSGGPLVQTPLVHSPLIQTPPRLPLQPEAGTSGSTQRRFDPVSSQPSSHGSPVPDRGLQAYSTDKVSRQMVEVFEACQQQSSDLSRKEMCRVRLQRDIQHVFPMARLYLTGSSMNGLGCRSSDADLCLVLDPSRRPDAIHVLTILNTFFYSLGYLEGLQLIRAKVPILKFKDRSSGVEFDLNINNTVGIRNTFLLRTYAHADLRVKPMILVIKKWARHHQINDASKGTLSSYTLVLMVLHYLQTLREPVLPSFQKEYPECFNLSLEVDMVPEGPKHIPPYVSRNQSSLGDLLLGFLKYYANVFSWDKQVISVREAKALPKSNCREWRDKYICIEEPFEKNNVARAVYEKVKFDAIKAQFTGACSALERMKDLNSILPVKATINKETSRR